MDRDPQHDDAPTLAGRGVEESAGRAGLQDDSSAIRAALLHHATIAEYTAKGLAARIVISEAWRRVLLHSASRLREIAGGAS